MAEGPTGIQQDLTPAAADRGAVRALVAVSRLLSATTEGTAADIHAAMVKEARTVFAAEDVVLLAQEPGRRLRVIDAGAPVAGGAERLVDLDAHRTVAELLDRRVRMLRLEGPRAADLDDLAEDREPAGPAGHATGADSAPPRSALLLLLRAVDGLDGALVLLGLGAHTDGEVATAFADAAAAALDRLRAVEEHERAAAQQQALTRAAKSLNETLDLDTVLQRICHEAAGILGSTIATVYRGSVDEGLTIAAAHGMPLESIGYELPAGAGLAGKVLVQQRAMLTNDYPRVADLPPEAPYPLTRSAMAAPMVWDGAIRGVLTLGFEEGRALAHADLTVLETFAEFAATACANASAHAGLALVARTDGLTGCLNHAAFQEGLRKEIERAARRHVEPLSLVLIDLDHFKQVNEVHGHLAGDEVLRRAGHALRAATRPYDLAARYGGDEFALVAVEVDEHGAAEMALRTVERITDAIREFLPAGAAAGTAGVAEWSEGVSATELVARADRALLFAKHTGLRGQVQAFSAIPGHFRPGRFARADRALPDPPPMPAPRPAAETDAGGPATDSALPAAPAPPAREWPEHRVDDRLRKRTRQLALANALGTRLTAMTDVAEVVDAAVDELHRAFGYFCVALVRRLGDGRVGPAAVRGVPFLRLGDQAWSQPEEVGLIGRCLATRRPVLSNDVTAEPDYIPTNETGGVCSELVVPLWVGQELWGVLNLEELEPGAFDEEDLTLAQTVAAQIGSALRSAGLYEQLERAYLGTAEALAAALEAKDDYPADHPRTIAERAAAVGRELGVAEDEVRDLRFAAVFHDIGKIAVPEDILHKTGELSEAERRVIEHHTLVADEILRPVEFLADVRRLIRHEHERFDGGGYPDHLAGQEIPLGSRIILVCDALHAMISDRPYRRALPLRHALEELRRHAGTQFDPVVVDALLAVLRRELPAAG